MSLLPGFELPPQVDKTLDKNIQLVFEIWACYAGKNMAQVKLSDQRRKKIRAALQHYDLQTVLDAVIGWRHSDFHKGGNDRRQVYNDIETLLRDSKQVEHFASLTRQAGEQAPHHVPHNDQIAPTKPLSAAQQLLGCFEYSGAW